MSSVNPFSGIHDRIVRRKLMETAMPGVGLLSYNIGKLYSESGYHNYPKMMKLQSAEKACKQMLQFHQQY